MELIAVFAYLMKEYREYRTRLFLQLCAERAKSSGHNQHNKFLLNITERIRSGVVLGKSLPREVRDISAWRYAELYQLRP